MEKAKEVLGSPHSPSGLEDAVLNAPKQSESRAGTPGIPAAPSVYK